MITTTTTPNTFGSMIVFPLYIHLVLLYVYILVTWFNHSMFILSTILLHVIYALTSTKIPTFTHNAVVHSPDRYNDIVTYHMLSSTMMYGQL